MVTITNKHIGKIYGLQPDYSGKIACWDENALCPGIKVLKLEDSHSHFLHCGYWSTVETGQKFIAILYKEKVYKTWFPKGSEKITFKKI